MKVINYVLLTTAIGINGSVLADSQFEKNTKTAEQIYKQQQAEQERRQYQQYLRNKDHADGISQKSNPVGGRTADGKGYSGGYKWSTE